jgi:hypothetical protein
VREVSRFAGGVLVIAGVLGVTGCAPDTGTAIQLPPQGAAFDYQLGGVYDPPEGVEVVARDSTVAPPPDVYGICYVNAFQTQPGQSAEILDDRPDVVLHDADGEPVIDPLWPDEYLLDTSTKQKRDGIEGLLAPVFSTCKTRGYVALELDNLDSWSRSDGALTLEDNVALARQLVEYAHWLGLAVAQKNGAGDSERFRDEVGFDFAVTEECMRYNECDDYLDAYDGLVFDIEYGDPNAFAAACDDLGRPESMILRDLELTAPGDPAYLRETC